jgi:hypothetical protein
MNDILGSFKVGDKVYFGRNFGEKTLGEVIKVNRVKLKIRQLDARGTYRSYPVGTVWVVPCNLCSKADATAPAVSALAALPALPVEPKSRRSPADIMRQIQGLYSSLSPENLSCDGELSMTQVRRRAASYRRQLAECFRELGRKVDEDEAYRTIPGR